MCFELKKIQNLIVCRGGGGGADGGACGATKSTTIANYQNAHKLKYH